MLHAMAPRIPPRLTAQMRNFLGDSRNVFAAKRLGPGPVHVLFPAGVSHNVQILRSVFTRNGIEAAIHVAHKATRSSSLIRAARLSGACIDVASERELVSALSAGFTGKHIECTGPKSENFVTLALLHDCLISVDSVAELEAIQRVVAQLDTRRAARVLLRVADPVVPNRQLIDKPTRFGIPRRIISSLLTRIAGSATIQLVGFHFHFDGYDAEARGGFIECMLDLLRDSVAHGLRPDTISIGGGLRPSPAQEPSDWSQFVAALEREIIEGRVALVWGQDLFGLGLNERGRITGRERAVDRIVFQSPEDTLEQILLCSLSNGRTLREVLSENLLRLIVEPGFATFHNVGLTLVEVLHSKETVAGERLIIVDANRYNLSLARFYEYLVDPILVSPSSVQGFWHGFVCGNLCMEDDFLMKRQVAFETTPQAGDVLCFANTGAYLGCFEDAAPIQQHQGTTVVASYQNGEWVLVPDAATSFSSLREAIQHDHR